MPYEATSDFDVRDTSSNKGGIILKGQIIVIPMALRSEMKRRLHAVGLVENVKRGETTDGCEVCHAKPRKHNEPLKSHDGGNGPWRKVGVDLFELDGVDYLLTR